MVECTGLENQQGFVALRGFESHPLRQQNTMGPLAGPVFVLLAECGTGFRTLFDSGSGAAASEDAQVINREAINEAAP